MQPVIVIWLTRWNIPRCLVVSIRCNLRRHWSFNFDQQLYRLKLKQKATNQLPKRLFLKLFFSQTNCCYRYILFAFVILVYSLRLFCCTLFIFILFPFFHSTVCFHSHWHENTKNGDERNTNYQIVVWCVSERVFSLSMMKVSAWGKFNHRQLSFIRLS